MKNLVTIIIILLCAQYSYAQQWVQTGSIPQGSGVTDMLVTDNGTLIVTTGSVTSGQQGGIRRSTNGGWAWENVVNCFVGRTLFKGSSGNIYASYWEYPAFAESLYRSTDDGATWHVLHRISPPDNIFAIGEKDNGNTLFIGTRYGIKVSTNAGANFSFVSSGPLQWVRDIAVSSSAVYAATVNGVYKSANNGANWVQMGGVAPGDTVVKLSVNEGPGDMGNTRVTAGTQNGKMYEEGTELFLIAFTTGRAAEVSGLQGFGTLFLLSQFSNGSSPGHVYYANSDTSGPGNWVPREINHGLPGSRPVSALVIAPPVRGQDFTAYAGYFENTNNGAKIFKRDMSTAIEQVSEIPAGFELKQNYPNPFNPNTTINYELKITGYVSLNIYQGNGKPVRTLINERQNAGSYSVTFDGTALPSGVYYYTLQAGEFKETKKMLLIK